MKILSRISIFSLLVIVVQASSSPQIEEFASKVGEEVVAADTHPEVPQPISIRDPLRWIWIDETSLGMTWSSKFSLSLNDAVMGYGLSLTQPFQSEPFVTTTIYDSKSLQHKFEGLKSNISYGGKLEALVGPHHWPYNLLNFTFSSAALLQGVGLGQRISTNSVTSSTADLGTVDVGVTLRWSHSPFTTGALTFSEWDAGGGRPEGLKPDGYLLQIWDHKRLVFKLTTSVTGKHDGCMAGIGGLELDTVYKATLEGLHSDGRVGTTLSFSLDAGGFYVAGGALTTDGVSECYSGLQVRCPGSERCVSPYWICDGAPDCPDGVDEVGCDKSPCDGFRCWDNVCIPGAWRCDGHPDCKDGDDEYACAGCNEGGMACSTVGFCFFQNETCDGIPDCPDGWDESLAVCGGKECSPGELPCWDNDHCVQHYRLCDGTADCPTAEDEDRSFCVAFKSMQETTTLAVDIQASLCHQKNTLSKETNCSLDEFRCESGECIPRMYLCNGHFDCQTEDDEEPEACQLDNDIINVNNKIPNHVTDTEENEINSCGENMLKCPSGKCISISEKCPTNVLCNENHLDEASCKNYSETNLDNEIDSNSINEDLVTGVNINVSKSLVLDASSTLSSELDWEEGYDQEEDSDNRALNLFNISEQEINIMGTIKSTDGNFTMPPIIQDINLDSLEDVRETSFIGSSEESTFSQEDMALDGIDVSVEVIVEESGESAKAKTNSTINLYDVDDDDDDDEALITDFEFYDQEVIPMSLGNMNITSNTSISKADNSSGVTEPFTDGLLDNISSFDTNNTSSAEENEIDNIIINSTNILNLDSNEDIDIENTFGISVNSSLEEAVNKTKTEFLDTDHKDLTETFSQNVSIADSNIQNEKENMTTESSVYYLTSSDDPLATDDGLDTTTDALNISVDAFSSLSTTEGYSSILITTDDVDTPSQNITTEVPDVDVGLSPRLKMTEVPDVDVGLSPRLKMTEVPDLDVNSTMNPEISQGSTTTTMLSPHLTSSEETTSFDSGEQVPKEEEEGGQHKPTTELSILEPDILEAGNGTSTIFPSESDNWKEMPMVHKNLTILIAVHSMGNESKIPQYIIHGMDGSTYEYEVVSVNEGEDAVNKAEAREEDAKRQMANHELTGGIHELSYLQDNASSGMKYSLSIMLIMSSIFSIFLTAFKK